LLSRGLAASIQEAFQLAGALNCVGVGTRRSGWEGVFPSLRHPKRPRATALQTWVAEWRLCFGVLPACRSFGPRRNGNSSERLRGRVPERASSKAVASASTPNLGDEAAVFWSASGLPELWIALERELAGAAERAWSRACVIQSGRKRASASTLYLGGEVAMFWSAPACRSFGLRRSGNLWGRLGGRVPERASSKAVASASTPYLGGEAARFWSASDMAELWIASERELVGAARPACSRASVIRNGRELAIRSQR